MPPDLASWPRPHFAPGGGEAYLFFAIYGRFASDVELSGAEYRTAGVPAGISLRKLNRAQSPEFPFSSGPIGELLQPKQPALFAAIQDVPECTIIQGAIADPPDLNYLRDVIGLVAYFLDHGGVAAIDPQRFKLYDAAAWRADIFEPQPPVLTKQVLIIWSAEAGNTKWFHTRGLRKFGRPDLSIHGVQPEHERAVVELFNRFILLQAQGAVIPEGQEIRMAALPPGWTCHHAGSVDDPDFNNVHVDIRMAEGP